MQKFDLIAAFILGETSALIFWGILRFLEVPPIVLGLAKFFPIVLPALAILGTLIAWLIGRKIPVFFQMAKNILVGIGNTFIDLGILNLLMATTGIAFGWPITLFKAISFAAAVIHSYFWNKYWTFKKHETQVSAKEFSSFIGVALGGLLIHVSVISILVNVIGPQFGISAKLWVNLGAGTAVIAGFAWDFFGYKFIVFKK